MKTTKTLQAVFVLACAGALAACSNGGDSAPTGTLSVSLMDRSVDGVSELWITITEVWIKQAGDGPPEKLEMTTTPLTVNLLELDDQNASILVDEAVIDADTYNWIEFKVEDSEISDSYAITDAGGMVPVDVDVPSNSVRLLNGFEVGPNEAVRLLFDWDVRKGLTEAVGQEVLLLRPAFRMLDVDEYNAISGSITIDTMSACLAINDATAEKIVYIFEGDVTPAEISGSDTDPYATVEATLNNDTGTYDYRKAVMPGTYTVALACNGADDTDGVDGTITFEPPDGVVVDFAVDTLETVDF